MITSVLKDTCEIWRRIETGTNDDWYGARSADEFDLYEKDIPCLFLPTKGTEIIKDEAGNDIVIDGKIRVENEIRSTDRIVLGDYNYTILTVKEKINVMTEAIEYYEAMVSRRRKHAEEVSVIIKT